jgi:hypothetical protein
VTIRGMENIFHPLKPTIAAHPIPQAFHAPEF